MINFNDFDLHVIIRLDRHRSGHIPAYRLDRHRIDLNLRIDVNLRIDKKLRTILKALIDINL